jgi:casein kinase II subunit beta
MFAFRQAIDAKPPRERRGLFAESDRDISSEWVYDFLHQHDWVVSIESSYLRDDFNLFGLSSLIEDYTDAMRIILGNYYEPYGNKSLTKQTCDLYAMIHARYLLTVAGAQKMKDKFEKRKFGACPRAFCRSQALLPIGLDLAPGKAA